MSKYKFSLHLLLAASLAAGVFITGCKKDDNTTETENITKIVVHLTGITDPAFHGEFNWKDPDGDGGTGAPYCRDRRCDFEHDRAITSSDPTRAGRPSVSV
mgnify:CR=1 FL=1